jgi:hypothetical protein
MVYNQNNFYPTVLEKYNQVFSTYYSLHEVMNEPTFFWETMKHDLALALLLQLIEEKKE